MDTKQMLYAAVGAPVTAAKSLGTRAAELRSELGKRSEGLSDRAAKQFDEWAAEGRQIVNRVSERKMVDDLASRVDFDQAREQVTKLRDQLEDRLATWRASFRPAETAAAPRADIPAEDPAQEFPDTPA